jgi:hypothetical protein
MVEGPRRGSDIDALMALHERTKLALERARLLSTTCGLIDFAHLFNHGEMAWIGMRGLTLTLFTSVVGRKCTVPVVLVHLWSNAVESMHCVINSSLYTSDHCLKAM